MSEEEIMQGINRIIAFMKEELKAEHSCFTIKELWSLNGLLDLYNKEKEKNKKIEKKIEDLEKTIYPTPENPISIEIQSSETYKKLKELLEEN